MSKLTKVFKEYFYACGDNDPAKKVLRYGKTITLENLHKYDDYVHYRPRRQLAGGIVIIGGLSLIGLSVKGIKGKLDKREIDKEISSLK